MRKMRPRKMKQLAQSHGVSTWQIWTQAVWPEPTPNLQCLQRPNADRGHQQEGWAWRTRDILSQSWEGEKSRHGGWVKKVARKNEDSARKKGNSGSKAPGFRALYLDPASLLGRRNSLKWPHKGSRHWLVSKTKFISETTGWWWWW